MFNNFLENAKEKFKSAMDAADYNMACFVVLSDYKKEIFSDFNRRSVARILESYCFDTNNPLYKMLLQPVENITAAYSQCEKYENLNSYIRVVKTYNDNSETETPEKIVSYLDNDVIVDFIRQDFFEEKIIKTLDFCADKLPQFFQFDLQTTIAKKIRQLPRNIRLKRFDEIFQKSLNKKTYVLFIAFLTKFGDDYIAKYVDSFLKHNMKNSAFEKSLINMNASACLQEYYKTNKNLSFNNISCAFLNSLTSRSSKIFDIVTHNTDYDSFVKPFKTDSLFDSLISTFKINKNAGEINEELVERIESNLKHILSKYKFERELSNV